MIERRATKRRRGRRAIVCALIYLGVCGAAYLAGALGNTDGSGLSYWWFGLTLLPSVLVWAVASSDPPFLLTVLSSMALNVGLIYWMAEAGGPNRRPKRPKRWGVETRGNSIVLVKRRPPPDQARGHRPRTFWR